MGSVRCVLPIVGRTAWGGSNQDVPSAEKRWSLQLTLASFTSHMSSEKPFRPPASLSSTRICLRVHSGWRGFHNLSLIATSATQKITWILQMLRGYCFNYVFIRKILPRSIYISISFLFHLHPRPKTRSMLGAPRSFLWGHLRFKVSLPSLPPLVKWKFSYFARNLLHFHLCSRAHTQRFLWCFSWNLWNCRGDYYIGATLSGCKIVNFSSNL